MPAPPRGEGLERNLTVFCSLADVPADKTTRKLDAVDGGVGVCSRFSQRGSLSQHAKHATARGVVGPVCVNGAGVQDALRIIQRSSGDGIALARGGRVAFCRHDYDNGEAILPFQRRELGQGASRGGVEGLC